METLNKKLTIISLVYLTMIFFAIPQFAFGVEENLDEIFSRKTRQITNSYPHETLEDKLNSYIWQPETLQYNDIQTGAEVWRMTSGAKHWNAYLNDISLSIWSADGKMMVLTSTRPTQTFNYTPSLARPRYMIVNTDGTKLRMIPDAPNRVYNDKFHWSPALSDVYYSFGSTLGGQTRFAEDTLYKVVVSDIGTTSSALLDFNVNAKIDKLISADGKKILAVGYTPLWYSTPRYYPAVIYPEPASNVIDSDGWSFNIFGDSDYGYMPDYTNSAISTKITGENNDITFTANGVVTDGAVSVQYLAGGTAGSESISVSASGDITVAVESGISTAAQVKSALEKNAQAMDLISVSYSGTDDGSGAVIATSKYIISWVSHDAFLPGNGDWAMILPESTTVSTFAWFKVASQGSASDGGPLWTGAEGTPPTFGEIWPENVRLGGTKQDPWDCGGYWSHPAFDRWGRYVAFADNTGPLVSGGGNVYDYKNHEYEVHGDVSTSRSGVYHPQHTDWSSFSDWVAFSDEKWGVSQAESNLTRQIFIYKHNAAPVENDTWRPVASTHSRYNWFTSPDTAYISADYNTLPRPTQSPDGTKISFVSSFLNPLSSETRDDAPDTFWAVAYYPHPPEISNVTASNGTVTVQFDWRLNTLTPRGYTNRGWPDEETNAPPAPRETNYFRLWRSSDNSTWTPIDTVKANSFEKFDYANGGIKAGQNPYWTITDTPPTSNGLYYYAVTAIEHSGLESRTLSNIYAISLSDGAGIGAQWANYPNDPKGVSKFYTNYNPSNTTLIRYYNIYAKDGNAPTISIQCRIASISAGVFTGYIDWLGNPDGSTQYIITAVDTQGNESAGLPTEYHHKKFPATANGQYLVKLKISPTIKTGRYLNQ